MNLAQEAIHVTLKYIDVENVNWIRSNEDFSTRILKFGDVLKRAIPLSKDEVPLLEFDSVQGYSLVTTTRVISIREQELFEVDMKDIHSIRPLITQSPFEDQKPKNKLRVIDKNKDEFLAEFDPGNPTYFAMLLVDNLKWKVQRGKWHRNPSEK